jgi:hypothetical protein
MVWSDIWGFDVAMTRSMFGGTGAFPALFRATFPELPMTPSGSNFSFCVLAA